jgi:hypothetical protein
MEQHQIPTRSRASAMSRGLNEVLTKEYLEARLAEGVGPADIAADLETTVTTVRRYMAEAGLAPAAVPNPKYDGILPLSRIQQEFLDKDLTLAEFSAKVGVPQEEVRRRLQAAGLEVPRRRNTLLSRYPTEVTIREAAEMGAPAWFPVTAAELEALYVVEGRSTLEIAEQLDVDPMLVQRYLVVRRGFGLVGEGGSASVDLGEDVVGGLGPDEGLWVDVPVIDPVLDGVGEFGDAGERAAA